MKFNFNDKFKRSLNEILDTREKDLKEHIQGNYVLCKDDIEDRLNEVEEIIERSEIEYKFNLIEQDDLEDALKKSELESRILRGDQEKRILDLESKILRGDQESRIDELVKRLSEVDNGFLTAVSIDERILEEIDTRCLNEDDLKDFFSSLESRIEDLENQENDMHALKILRDDQELRILTLESDNQALKERLLTLENFLLKTFKGFNND